MGAQTRNNKPFETWKERRSGAQQPSQASQCRQTIPLLKQLQAWRHNPEGLAHIMYKQVVPLTDHHPYLQRALPNPNHNPIRLSHLQLPQVDCSIHPNHLHQTILQALRGHSHRSHPARTSSAEQ